MVRELPGNRRPISPVREDGFTLVELLAVMVVLSIVLLGLTTTFVAGSNAQVAIGNRATAQQNARIALDKMRLDLHCAGGVPDPVPNGLGGWSLTLTESPSRCPSVTTGSAGVQWCTIPYAGSAVRYQLFRETSGNCDGLNSTLLVDYVTSPPGGWPQDTQAGVTVQSALAGNIWTTPSTCPTGTFPTVAIDLDVNVDPIAHAEQDYELTDAIALRNSNTCP